MPYISGVATLISAHKSDKMATKRRDVLKMSTSTFPPVLRDCNITCVHQITCYLSRPFVSGPSGICLHHLMCLANGRDKFCQEQLKLGYCYYGHHIIMVDQYGSVSGWCRIFRGHFFFFHLKKEHFNINSKWDPTYMSLQSLFVGKWQITSQAVFTWEKIKYTF